MPDEPAPLVALPGIVAPDVKGSDLTAVSVTDHYELPAILPCHPDGLTALDRQEDYSASQLTMTAHTDLPDLEDLWCEEDASNLSCCHCGALLGTGPLIRTFRLKSLGPHAEDRSPKPSKTIKALDEEIIFFDRHLDCLLTSHQSYVTISHVWDPEISKVQAAGRQANQNMNHIRRRLFQSPIKISHALMAISEVPLEVWHDYFSVPQWEDDIKTKILQGIPGLYSHSHFTLIHMDDVECWMVERLRQAGSPLDRLSGITGICNAKWYKRVWTIMENIRSQHTKVLIKDHQLVAGVDDAFYEELARVWRSITAYYKNVHEVERLAGLGTNLVPWNLGNIDLGYTQDKKVDFGSAYALLSKRGCRDINDFFHALVGIVDADPTCFMRGETPQESLQMIANSCLEAGDHSPLLVIPMLGTTDPRNDTHWMKREGYNSAFSFGLGRRVSGPGKKVSFISGKPVLTLERIGSITYVHKVPRHLGKDPNFAYIVYIVLGFTGPEAREFAETVAGRLFNQTEPEISSLLADEQRIRGLEDLLQQMDDSEDSRPVIPQNIDKAMQIAALLRLTARSPSLLDEMFAHGGTLHAAHFWALIGATCKVCHRTHLFRAALYGPPRQIRSAVAYRIPQLHHFSTRANGVGILIRNGIIVGRLVWASPACKCDQIEEIEVSVPTIPLPRPRD